MLREREVEAHPKDMGLRGDSIYYNGEASKGAEYVGWNKALAVDWLSLRHLSEQWVEIHRKQMA